LDLRTNCYLEQNGDDYKRLFFGHFAFRHIAINANIMLKSRSGLTGVLLPTNSMKKELASIRFTAMNILAGREHSLSELRTKLKQKARRNLEKTEQPEGAVAAEQFEELIEVVLEQLLQDKLLDDRRFTESFVRSRISRGNGPVKIRHELLERGITGEIIDDCLDESYEFWQESIAAVRSKRFGAQYPENYKEQTKQSRFLYQRGFGSELIRRLFNDY